MTWFSARWCAAAGLLALVACGDGGDPGRRSAACADDGRPWVDFVRSGLDARPLMTAVDIYKMVHQGLAGTGHAAPSRGAAAEWLSSEIAGIRAGDAGPASAADEPLAEPVRPDSTLVRVNLRPWLESGRTGDSLLDAFLATAAVIRPTAAALGVQFRSVGSCLVAAAESGDLPVDAEALRAVFEEAREAGYPARHHSAPYEEAYRPAYRVVDPSLLAIE